MLLPFGNQSSIDHISAQKRQLKVNLISKKGPVEILNEYLKPEQYPLRLAGQKGFISIPEKNTLQREIASASPNELETMKKTLQEFGRQELNTIHFLLQDPTPLDFLPQMQTNKVHEKTDYKMLFSKLLQKMSEINPAPPEHRGPFNDQLSYIDNYQTQKINYPDKLEVPNENERKAMVAQNINPIMTNKDMIYMHGVSALRAHYLLALINTELNSAKIGMTNHWQDEFGKTQF